ncbi:MAG: hypothetical protein GY830_05060 [Bacteroidetes bacterium]|nr:hypothetical protein [Bacteroidota bacterium]
MYTCRLGGGAGKTYLSHIYGDKTICTQKEKLLNTSYKHIWEIHSERPDTIRRSIKEITTDLEIEQQYSKITDEIRLNYFRKKLKTNPNFLLIFDNVPNAKNLPKKIPLLYKNDHLINIKNEGAVLITTRSDDDMWNSIGTKISINKLKPQESLKLLSKLNNPSTQEEYEIAKSLSQELGYLPLALSQAGHFLKAKKMSYKTYLKNYKTRNKQFQKQQKKYFKKESERIKHQTVETTFSMIIDEISKTKCTKETLRILRVMSYFDSEGISEVFF